MKRYGLRCVMWVAAIAAFAALVWLAAHVPLPDTGPQAQWDPPAAEGKR
jgi:hypothetical protein